MNGKHYDIGDPNTSRSNSMEVRRVGERMTQCYMAQKSLSDKQGIPERHIKKMTTMKIFE